jgi:hypothetical protein
VTQASDFLLELPDDTHDYDILDVFSSISPKSSIESVTSNLGYVKKLLDQLLGEEVLFVVVEVLPNGNFMVNLH